MKRAIIVGEVVGIKNSAMFIFAQNVSKLLKKEGIESCFVCEGVKKDKSMEIIDGVRYYFTGKQRKTPLIDNIVEKKELLVGKKLFDLFTEVVDLESPDIVFIYGYEAQARIIHFCKAHGILCVMFQTDWFEKSDRSGRFNKYIYQRMVDYCINNNTQLCDGILTVSDYLYDFLSRKNENVVKIYSLINCESLDINYKNDTNGVISIVYAGSPGNKDLIKPLIDALEVINKNRVFFTFTIVGIDNDFLCEEYGEKNYSRIGVNALGRKPHDETVEIIRCADFSILLRNNKRYAKAGFATKFAESMMYGVPVICTAVGGADKLVRDSENGFTIENNNRETIISLLEKMKSLSNQDINHMKDQAKGTAIANFSMESNIAKMQAFLEKMREKR